MHDAGHTSIYAAQRLGTDLYISFWLHVHVTTKQSSQLISMHVHRSSTHLHTRMFINSHTQQMVWEYRKARGCVLKNIQWRGIFFLRHSDAAPFVCVCVCVCVCVYYVHVSVYVMHKCMCIMNARFVTFQAIHELIQAARHLVLNGPDDSPTQLVPCLEVLPNHG